MAVEAQESATQSLLNKYLPSDPLRRGQEALPMWTAVPFPGEDPVLAFLSFGPPARPSCLRSISDRVVRSNQFPGTGRPCRQADELDFSGRCFESSSRDPRFRECFIAVAEPVERSSIHPIAGLSGSSGEVVSADPSALTFVPGP